jgi:multiple sugar transport system permease protein
MTTAQRTPVRPPSLKKALLTGLGVLVLFFFLAPYIQMFITSLRPADELYDIPTTYLPSRFEFSNYLDVWSEAPLWSYLRSSLIIAGFTTVVVLLVSLPAAYYTARFRYRGRLLFLLLVLITQMFAPTALVIGIYREFLFIGEILPFAGINTFVALIIVNSAFNLAFSTWIMVAYFSTIPVELEEAASIDGASRLGVLRRVTLPLALPGIVTATIFTFIAAWNEFVVALTLAQSPDLHPLTVGVTTFIGQYRVEWQFLFASSLIAIVPVVILFIIIERWLIGGLTAGSIK